MKNIFLFFLKLLFMDTIHHYIYIYRNISELFDCSVFKRQLSKDFVGMYTLMSSPWRQCNVFVLPYCNIGFEKDVVM